MSNSEKKTKGMLIGALLDKILPEGNENNITSYYRGQQGLDYLLLPKAMRVCKDRNGKLVKDYESKVTKTLIVDFPDDFNKVSPLVRLSCIEHRDLPSRLVNISASPINALFFSCNALDQNEHNSIPYVFRYDIDSLKNEMRSYDSDTGKILAALSMLTTEQQSNLRYAAVMDFFMQRYSYQLACNFDSYDFCIVTIADVVNACYSAFQVIMESLFDEKVSTRTVKTRIASRIFSLNLDSAFEKKFFSEFKIELDKKNKTDYIFSIFKHEFRTSFCFDYYHNQYSFFYPENGGFLKWRERFAERPLIMDFETKTYNIDVMNELHWKILADYPYFLQLAKPSSLLNGIFIQPVMSSERMIVQQGAFMLYGLSAFWNVDMTINYLLDYGCSLKEIVGILISEDTSFLKSGNDCNVNLHVPYYGKLDSDKLKSFLEYVHHVSIIKLDSAPDDIRTALNIMGISKSSSGRTPEMSIATLNEKLGINR